MFEEEGGGRGGNDLRFFSFAFQRVEAGKHRCVEDSKFSVIFGSVSAGVLQIYLGVRGITWLGMVWRSNHCKISVDVFCIASVDGW